MAGQGAGAAAQATPQHRHPAAGSRRSRHSMCAHRTPPLLRLPLFRLLQPGTNGCICWVHLPLWRRTCRCLPAGCCLLLVASRRLAVCLWCSVTLLLLLHRHLLLLRLLRLCLLRRGGPQHGVPLLCRRHVWAAAQDVCLEIGHLEALLPAGGAAVGRPLLPPQCWPPYAAIRLLPLLPVSPVLLHRTRAVHRHACWGWGCYLLLLGVVGGSGGGGSGGGVLSPRSSQAGRVACCGYRSESRAAQHSAGGAAQAREHKAHSPQLQGAQAVLMQLILRGMAGQCHA